MTRRVLGGWPVVAALAALLGSACQPVAERATEPSAGPAAESGPPVHRVGQDWLTPSGWRLKVAGMTCGPATSVVRARDPDAADVCMVALAFTNESSRSRSIGGTANDPGPLWRLVGDDGQGREFHGRAPLTATTGPGGRGTARVAFDVPAGLRLRRVLIGDASVRLR